MTESKQAKTGVVLAAGLGSRLRSCATGEHYLKPLMPIGGRPVIHRTLDGLERAGCERVVIVTGHEADEFQRALVRDYHGGLQLVFAFNSDYQLKNGVSVLAASPHLDGDFILTMSDHIFEPQVFELAGRHIPPERGATLLVDRKIEQVFDLDDATKVVSSAGRIVRIGKELESYDCIDTGMFVCTTGLLEALQAVFDAEGDTSLSDGIQALGSSNRMTVLDLGDAAWQDVDTPEMLEQAELLVARLDREAQARGESQPA